MPPHIHIDWTSVQWGPVSEWVTGGITAVSLVLAVLILRHDRTREKRAQVSKAAVELSRVDQEDDVEDRTRLRILSLWNHSDQPFFEVAVLIRHRQPLLMSTADEEFNELRTLLPGRDAIWMDEFPEGVERCKVMLRDAAGQYWTISSDHVVKRMCKSKGRNLSMKADRQMKILPPSDGHT